ncbi:MAG TPA: nickel insertion protein, partial [Myxococcales bacterium]
NLDDLSPQLAAVALEKVLAAGALDAWIAPVTMKKGRPGHLFGVLCTEAARADVETVIFRETSTLGIRATHVSRTVLTRELLSVQTEYGPIRVKLGRAQGQLVNAQPEFDDCRQAAERSGVPVKEVQAAALSAFRRA